MITKFDASMQAAPLALPTVPPVTQAVILTAVPKKLRALSQWVLWKWTWNPERKNWDKRPLQTSGIAAKINDPNTWTTFDNVASVYGAGGFSGIGFCFSKDDNLQVIDLDHCIKVINGEPKVDGWAQEICEKFEGACIERSPRDGLHIWYQASALGHQNHTWYEAGEKKAVEIFDYASPRFVCVTGSFGGGALPEPGDFTAARDWLCQKYKLGLFAAASASAQGASISRPMRLLTESERETVLKALQHIPADDYFIWYKVGMALKFGGFDLSVWETWSEKSIEFKPGLCAKKWASFRREGVGLGTIFHYAKQHGFSFPSNYFARNDSGNAARFAAHFGHQVRWYKPSKNWLVWDGKRWKPDTLERPVAFAKDIARLIFDEAHDSDALKFAAASASAAKIDAMLKLAKPDLALDADMLDLDPFLLNCNNGTINLQTGVLLPHRQEDLITKLAPVDYEPEAQAPRFELFLSEIFAGSQPLIDFVQCALGSSLTGSVKDQKLFIAHGSGQNGKSTLFGAIRAVLGDYTQETDPSLLVGHQKDGPSEGVFRLRGVRLATTTEGEEGISLNEARVKQLTGGDRLTARPLNGHFAEFDPSHKLWLITNPLPRIKSQGHAIWRRIRLIPFSVAISEASKDRDLPDKLRAEMPGILAWLVRGCIKWQSEGLPEPPEVAHATDRYKGEEDTLSEFIEDRCYIDAEAQAQTSILHGEYASWCRANNESHPTRNAFNARLREKGFLEKDTKTCKMWMGIGLKSHCETLAKSQLDDPWKVLIWGR